MHSMDRERRSVCMFSSNFFTASGLLVDIFEASSALQRRKRRKQKSSFGGEETTRRLRNASCLPPMNRRVTVNPNSSLVFCGKENKKRRGPSTRNPTSWVSRFVCGAERRRHGPASLFFAASRHSPRRAESVEPSTSLLQKSSRSSEVPAESRRLPSAADGSTSLPTMLWCPLTRHTDFRKQWRVGTGPTAPSAGGDCRRWPTPLFPIGLHLQGCLLIRK